MRNRVVMVSMLIVVIAGCAAVQVQIDPVLRYLNIFIKAITREMLIGKILARRVGYELAIAVPEQAAELIPYAQEVMEAEDVKAAAEAMAIKLMELQLPGQPLLIEDIRDLVSIFNFDMPWSEEYIESIKLIAEQFIHGVVLGRGK